MRYWQTKGAASISDFMAKSKETAMQTVIERGGKHYMVSTVETFDNGWETMVFLAAADGSVIDWTDLDCQRYDSEEEAKGGHLAMVNHFDPIRREQQLDWLDVDLGS